MRTRASNIDSDGALTLMRDDNFHIRRFSDNGH